MVTEVLAATNDVHTIVKNAKDIVMQIIVPCATMAITPVLLETAHQGVYPDVKHAHQEPRVHHARTDITIPVIYAISYVQTSVSPVLRILFVNRVRMVII
jgi:hypothetical protein